MRNVVLQPLPMKWWATPHPCLWMPFEEASLSMTQLSVFGWLCPNFFETDIRISMIVYLQKTIKFTSLSSKTLVLYCIHLNIGLCKSLQSVFIWVLHSGPTFLKLGGYICKYNAKRWRISLLSLGILGCWGKCCTSCISLSWSIVKWPLQPKHIQEQHVSKHSSYL